MFWLFGIQLIIISNYVTNRLMFMKFKTKTNTTRLLFISRTEIGTEVCVSVNLSSSDGNRVPLSYLSPSHYFYIVSAVTGQCHCRMPCEGLDLDAGVSAYLCRAGEILDPKNMWNLWKSLSEIYYFF